MPDNEPQRHVEEPPPILGRWRNLYTIVLVVLAAEILLFTLITRWAQ